MMPTTPIFLALPVFLALLGGLQAPDAGPPAPLPPLPDERQLRWQERRYYAFVHFNMNTFTGVEWGGGREDPDLFQPSELDCRQWARVARAAGMSGIILTAKHHDGFCLWPSATTAHTVAASSWRDGKGDVLRELARACAEEGLGLGLYLSPWDRNHPAYGDSPRYNQVFQEQLREILSGYGELFEVWFDGACGEGPNGKRQEYDWPAFVGVVRELQPGAVIFSDAGPDVRWVGNERGFAGETNWCLLRRDEVYPGYPDYHELTEGHADGTHWVPAECDVSIRPGWYYHADQDGAVKSVAELDAIWHGSVGRNANLLLNLPVDRRGLVHEIDVERLMGLRRLLDATYDVDLAQGRPARASEERGSGTRFAAARALDGDPATYWAVGDETRAAWIEVELDGAHWFDRIWLEEAVALGQRVEAFRVEAESNGAWRELARGTTIGMRRILRFPAVRAERVRLRVDGARAAPTLSKLALYLGPPEISIAVGAPLFLERTAITLRSDRPDARIHYTLDGSAPTAASLSYEAPIELTRSATLRATAFHAGKESVMPVERRFERIERSALLPALHLFRAPSPGLRWSAFAGEFASVDELAELEPVAAGVTTVIDASVRPGLEAGALVFEGYIEVPADDVYGFYLASDAAALLELDGRRLIETAGARELEAHIGLAAGYHRLRLVWFATPGAASLSLRARRADGPLAALDPTWVGH